MIALVDLNIGNLGSIMEALRRIGAPPTETATADNIGEAAAIVLPGVGAFGDGMASLRNQGLEEPIRAAASHGVPVLGICLGMQLLAQTSEEHGTHQGLGLIRGHVIKLNPTCHGFRVPNIGWCEVTPTRESVLFPDKQPGSFYHVHSFHLRTEDPVDVAASMQYSGEAVTCAVQQSNVMGVQFHPEKSQDDGLQLLDHFFDYLRRGGRA